MPKHADRPTMQDVGKRGSFIAQAFARLTPPTDPFDPDGAWRHVYHDISSFGLKNLQGELSLEHRPKGQLHIESYRSCPNSYRYYTIADLQCDSSILSTPSQWRMESKVAKGAKAAPYLNSGMIKEARVKDRILTLRVGKTQRTVKLPGSYTCKWCLLAAVGRMATAGTQSISFTLLDEYDEPLPDQRIKFHAKTKVKTRGGTIDVICYQHTGVGTMPGVFYVDSAGRVLFYLAGMELLALASADGKATGYLK